MKLIAEVFSWWVNKYRRGRLGGKIVFILVNLFVIACLVSFPVVWATPDPNTEEATRKYLEISHRIEDWNTRLDELDLELYAQLQTDDTESPQPYQEILSAASDLEIESLGLAQLKDSFAGQVIGWRTAGCAECPIHYTKEYQRYVDRYQSNHEKRHLLEERRLEIARARGGLVHTPAIDTLWNERLTLVSQIEAEQPSLAAAKKVEQAARSSPWGRVKMIYKLIGLGLGILVFLVIFTAFLGG